MHRIIAFVAIIFISGVARATHHATADPLDECLQSLIPENAIAACTEVLAWPDLVDEQRAIVLTQRGQNYTMQDANTAALADFDAALAFDPANHEARYGRATLRVAAADYASAVADFDIILAKEPKYMPAYHNRGYAHEKLGQYQKAVADFTAVIALVPTLARAYNNRGVAYRKCGELDLALADFHRAIELEPRYAQAYANRGVVHAAIGSKAEAEHDFQAALVINADNEIARAGLRALNHAR